MFRCIQQPPLKVIRAFPQADGAALVHLHNISGGVLGGDMLQTEVMVGPQARVQLTTTSATRIYRCREEAPAAAQTMRVQVREGGLLEYLPDPLIPFAGARYRQQTMITLEEDAGLFWWETLAPGRIASGEVFAYERLQTELRIVAANRPLACEYFSLEPARRSPSALAGLGRYNYLSSFYICRVGQSAAYWLELEKQLAALVEQLSQPEEILWGVSALAAHGLVVRALSMQARSVSTGLLTFWRAAKSILYQREIIPPRKIM